MQDPSDELVGSLSHRNIGSIGRPRTRIETAQSIPSNPSIRQSVKLQPECISLNGRRQGGTILASEGCRLLSRRAI